MLKALDEMKDVCDFPWTKIIYVMTDFTEKNFKFWQDHPSLKSYFDSGRLDAGIFDAVNDNTVKLWKSGKVLSAGSLKNPMCIVANYLFDTLYHDIFQVCYLLVYFLKVMFYPNIYLFLQNRSCEGERRSSA